VSAQLDPPARSDGNGEKRLRVLVVDDHDVVHWGFRLMLSDLRWVQRCLSARTGDEALDLTRRYKPDVALVDLFLGAESGPDVCERLLAECPELRVLLISGAGRISAATAAACGASGFVPKDWPAADVARAVRMVALGIPLFEEDVQVSPPIQLTGREREVLARVAGGATNREIAAELHLSPHTVKEHTSALYRKLDVRNRAEAVQRAQRLGLLA
jgi:two-component system response regulator DesR